MEKIFTQVESTVLSKKKRSKLIKLIHDTANQNLHTLNNSHLFLHIPG